MSFVYYMKAIVKRNSILACILTLKAWGVEMENKIELDINNNIIMICVFVV